MKKFLACALVLSFASVAVAQSEFYFDTRNNTGAAGSVQNITSPGVPYTNGQSATEPNLNGGRQGDGAILRICQTNVGGTIPNFQNTTRFPNFDGDNNLATGDLHLFVTMREDSSGTNDVLAAIGLDVDVSDTVTGNDANRIAALSWSWNPAFAWDGSSSGTVSADAPDSPPDVSDVRAVNVPVNATPAYDITGALTTGAGGTDSLDNRIATLRVTAGACNTTGGTANAARSTFNVHLRLDSMLNVRVFEAGGDLAEMNRFGYAGGVPEEPAFNGSDPANIGMASIVPDAVIKIRRKGDGNGNGTVTVADTGAFVAAATNAPSSDTVEQSYLFDMNGTANGAVTVADTGGFIAASAAGAVGCP